MFKMNYVAKLGTKSHEGINIKQRPQAPYTFTEIRKTAMCPKSL